jgi:hypothetical protein
MSCEVNDAWWERAYEEHYDESQIRGQIRSGDIR